jgi:hypothetical protein
MDTAAWRRRIRRVTLATAIIVLLTAAPAAADPARPTNFRSRALAMVPSVPGVHVDVVGGDAFLRLQVDDGHTAVVAGYEGEPYLRVLANGTVEENRRSPAVLLNTARYSTTAPQPAEVDANAEPRWSKVASGGEYAWHDHRVHWMGKSAPSQRVTAWQVPLVVDGTDVTVHGEYRLEAAPSALGWLAAAVVLGGVVAWLARRRAIVVTALALAGAGTVALVVSAIGELGLPTAAGRRYSLVALPLIVLACGVGALAMPRTRSAPALVAGGALTLPLWFVQQFGVLTHAVPPTDVDVTAQRAAIAFAIAVTLACLVVGGRTELRNIARVEDAEDVEDAK